MIRITTALLIATLMLMASVRSYEIHPDAVIWRTGQSLSEAAENLQTRITLALQNNPREYPQRGHHT